MRIRVCVTYSYDVPVGEYDLGDGPMQIMAGEAVDLVETLTDAIESGEAFVRVEVVSGG